MTRLWLGERIQMQVDGDGMPVSFTWRGQRHPVALIARHWRVNIGWWRLHVWRDHFKLATETGLLVVVYQDRLTGQWYFQRLYD